MTEIDGGEAWPTPRTGGTFKPAIFLPQIRIIHLNVCTQVCPIKPRWDHTVIVPMHIQTKSDSKTLGIPLNANKGFFHTKGQKEKRRGKEEKRWGKLTFPRDLNRSKAFYSPRPLSLGRLLYRRLKSPTLEASSSVSWRLGDVQLGPQKLEHAAFLNGRPCKATGGAGVCRPAFLPGPLCTDPPRHVFHSPAQKSASTVMRHQLFDNNMTQLIRTRLQNVCLWGPASSAMCLRRRSDWRALHWHFGVERERGG